MATHTSTHRSLSFGQPAAGHGHPHHPRAERATDSDTAAAAAAEDDDDDESPYNHTPHKQLSASLPEPLPVSSMNHPKRSLILSRKLQQIFQLPPDEELLAEYPAWLFRSLLLKGYLYLTSAHLCFYAFLRSNEREADDDPESALKAGILTRHHSRSKLDQRQASKKSWFILKNTILSWYPSSHELFFPTGQIDLHFCTKLELPNPNSKNPNQFKLFVSGKVYTFSSDTQQSRDDWLKLLQQTIFACQHDGQNVKIAIPLSAIENIQKCDSIQFAQTVCIKIKENAPAIPFAPNSQAIQEEIGDSSLVDYFFGFLQDSQTPYEQLKAALERVQASSSSSSSPPPSSSSSSSSSPPDPPPAATHDSPRSSSSTDNPFRSPHSLSPIRDSTRFRLPSTPLPKPGEDYFASSAPTPLSRSGSQLMASSPSDYYSEERKTKFTDKITKIASTSIKFVGSPIRPATNNTVKVHSPAPRPTDSPLRSTTPDSVSRSPLSATPSSPPNTHHHQEQLPPENPPSDPPKPTRPSRSATTKNPLAQSHTYPPKDRRSQYSTYNPRDKSDSTPPDSISNSPLPTPHESTSADHHHHHNNNKSWALLPGWLKNVPVTLNPIKPAKDVINSAKGLMASAQDASASTSATKKDPPTQSQSVDKLSDEEGTGEAQLTQRDQFKFQSEFNFLTPGVVSSNSANPEGLIRLLLKTKCNLVRSGSSMYGQVYLASPVPPAPSSKQKTARKSCVCFKGQKVMSIAPIKMILPIEALTAVRSDALKLFLTTQPTDALVGQEEVCFEFANPEQIKAVHDEILRMVEAHKQQQQQQKKTDQDGPADDREEEEDEDDGASLPIMFQSSSSSFLTFKPQSKLHITCLTIGSRGDVQPYIALCQKLQRDGHTCRIASHGEYRTWVEGYGIEYVEIGGDPAELMKICVDNGMFTLGFLKEAFSKFRGWLDELLVSSFDACQGTDLLIESPSTMAGIHIAEALQIPYFRAFTMPWTRTKEYPHAFAVPDRKMGSGYNYMTYTVFDQVFWKAMSGQVNKWRKEKLGLRSTTYEKLEVHKVPFLYNFSPSIVPAPLDWYEWIHVTGYWFIDEHDPNKLSQQQPPPVQVDSPTSEPTITQSSSQKSSWDAPPDLLAFLDRAHSQNKKVVYIGFGSIVVPDPEATTKVIIESVKTAGVYAIVSKGWSERLSSGTAGKKGKRANTSEEEGMAEEEDLSMVYQIAAIPHDWLFPRIDAVCHHGGSGTTGASLRAGIPTIIKPFFGDQFFWAERVESLGIGAGLRKLSVKTLASALTLATSDPTQISRARIVGQLIRNEDGAGKAVECIYRDLDYARSLIKPRPAPQAPQPQPHTISRPSPKGQTGSPHAARASGEGTSEGSEANASSLLLMSAHSSGSDDPDRQPDTLPTSGSSSGAAFFDCAHPPSSALTLVPHHPTPSTSSAADGPSEDTTARPEAGPHALLGQRSDTTIGPTADPVPGTRRPPAAKGKQKALPADDEDVERAGEVSTTKSSAPTPPDEHRSSASDASEASWDILSQQSKSDPDPAAAADLSASFDQF
ncbi:hypothetical protein PTTG_27466 [Puccinia triticina 1-1 BBBD Race 1]|uniref:Sterol 3-beta-glucosyltransferase n=1 Tax=Puccinia triticina (isolate 1-1 / race 1 (BBBD)) TaxID=630390 RepID=A0A180GL32_PUCT1|nr:hypothetical protein PTTG_27466 [Puccinia triticina 1-1 BBBD Race 1]